MESPHLLWRLLQISFALLVFTVPTYLVNVAVFATYFQAAFPPGTAGLWVGLCFTVGLGWLATAWKSRTPQGRTAQALVPWALALFALTFSLLLGWFLHTVFAVVTPVEQLALAAFYVGVVILGSLTLAAQPLSAVVWVAGLYAGIIPTVSEEQDWAGSPTGLMLLCLTVVLVAVGTTYHRMFLARLRAEAQAFRQSEIVGLLLHDFEEGTQDWLWETDRDGCLTNVSPRLAGQLGRNIKDIEGRPLVDLIVIDKSKLTVEEDEDVAALRQALAADQPFGDLEVPAQSLGSYRRWRLSAKPVLAVDGSVEGWRGVGTDVTEVERLNNMNARLALLDGLTGLANRHRLMTVLHDHLSPREGGRPLSLVLIDLQGFRTVNEGLGHEVGDQLLKDVAQRLRTRVHSSALLARLGGDEFGLVVPGADKPALEGVLAAVGSAAEEPFIVDGHRIEVEFQMGMAFYPSDASSATELLKCAELALHEAKSLRQGVPIVYVPGLGNQAKARVQLQAELKMALIQGEFELHYQPQVRAADRVLVGAEALVRWRHPQRGLVSPGEFVPVLEDTGLIIPVGIWIMEAACREALGWPDGEKVAVNVSAVQFASRTFLDSVRGVLAATGFPPPRLELEITESVMAQDAKQVIHILNELRSMGISISLDDFGTGYSSLSYLRSLPLDKLKVDQSFVRVLGQDPSAAAIVRTVLELSKTLGLKTTAEGVETEAQRLLLLAMGVDNIQGYFYSKPVPAEGFKAFRESLKASSVH